MTADPEGQLDALELAPLIDAIEDYAIFLLSPTGEIRSWNKGATRTMGYQANEVVGSHFSRFYGREDLEAEKPQRELDTATREGRVEDEGWRIRKDGTRFWANTVITPLRGRDGSVVGYAKVTRDLTERRESEERLRQSEEVFRLLVNSVKEYAIFLLDPQGRIVTWNAGAERIKGYTRDEIVGEHFSRFYPEEDKKSGKPERELEIAVQTGSVEDEGWRIRKDGTRFWSNVVITAVKDEHGELRGFAKVTRDLTEKKRAEETQMALFEQREARFLAEEERRRAEASSRAAEEANRAKDEFLMTLSHELRTPLTSILGWARLLPAMSPQDESFKEAIAAIGRNAQLQARLIDDVLDVSSIVSGKLRLNLENVDVLHMLTSALESVRPAADAKVIRLATSFAPRTGTLPADPTRLQQIIWNLLSNAVKFTPTNGTVELRARRTDSHVEIAVADDGEGIEPAVLPHIFEPFWQVENPSTRIHGGLGLGLSIVRYLTEAHGGTVRAESEGRGTGAIFTVTLPIGAPALEQVPVPAAEEMAPAKPLGQRLAGTKVLLVDDDHDGRMVVRAVLRQAGAEVTDVDSAGYALASLAGLEIDLVITDVAMPGVDGHALARRIRELAPQLKIIALTAFPVRRRDASGSVFDAYMAKPVEPGDLVDGIVRVMGS